MSPMFWEHLNKLKLVVYRTTKYNLTIFEKVWNHLQQKLDSVQSDG